MKLLGLPREAGVTEDRKKIEEFERRSLAMIPIVSEE